MAKKVKSKRKMYALYDPDEEELVGSLFTDIEKAKAETKELMEGWNETAGVEILGDKIIIVEVKPIEKAILKKTIVWEKIND